MTPFTNDKHDATTTGSMNRLVELNHYLGGLFRSKRQQRGLSLEAVAEDNELSIRLAEALEIRPIEVPCKLLYRAICYYEFTSAEVFLLCTFPCNMGLGWVTIGRENKNSLKTQDCQIED